MRRGRVKQRRRPGSGNGTRTTAIRAQKFCAGPLQMLRCVFHLPGDVVPLLVSCVLPRLPYASKELRTLLLLCRVSRSAAAAVRASMPPQLTFALLKERARWAMWRSLRQAVGWSMATALKAPTVCAVCRGPAPAEVWRAGPAGSQLVPLEDVVPTLDLDEQESYAAYSLRSIGLEEGGLVGCVVCCRACYQFARSSAEHLLGRCVIFVAKTCRSRPGLAGLEPRQLVGLSSRLGDFPLHTARTFDYRKRSGLCSPRERLRSVSNSEAGSASEGPVLPAPASTEVIPVSSTSDQSSDGESSDASAGPLRAQSPRPRMSARAPGRLCHGPAPRRRPGAEQAWADPHALRCGDEEAAVALAGDAADSGAS